MHYYTFNPKDYISKTSFLEPIEDIAYRRMLDYYYLTELPLPSDIDEIAMLIRMRTHCDSIAFVLRQFFELTADGYINDRANREIDAYHAKSEKAKASANARWGKKPNKNNDVSADANALLDECDRNANNKQLTNNNKQLTIDNNIASEKKVRFVFGKELIEKGADAELVSEYMSHRKSKKASNSKIAFDGLIREQQKSNMDLNSVMRLCIERGWRGFESDWVNKQASSTSSQQQNRPPDIGQFMRENANQFFDSNEEQFYLENNQ